MSRNPDRFSAVQAFNVTMAAALHLMLDERGAARQNLSDYDQITLQTLLGRGRGLLEQARRNRAAPMQPNP